MEKRASDKKTADIISKHIQEMQMLEMEKAIKLEKEKKEDEILKLKNPKEYEIKKQEKEIADNNKLFDNLGFDPKMKEIMSRFYQGVSG